MYNQCTLPTLFATFPLVRSILIREQIDIVHGHSAFSTIAHEVMFHGKTLGIRTVFTDHSLFGFADASAIITNKLLQMSLSLCDGVICVSHTGKENTALRAMVHPNKISVISNAVDTEVFTPDPSKRNSNRITIIVISRLVYRKGIDLLARLIPVVCDSHPNVDFIIGGDGPKRIVLEEVIERHELQGRVTLLGSVKHEEVRNVLVQGDIFLNSSLTEAFCMAIVEAAACGLQVVSTNVGGIPEVLPSDLVWLADPTVEGLIQAINSSIEDKLVGRVVDPLECHRRIQKYYQWQDIAERTLKVYDDVETKPVADLRSRLKILMTCGPGFGYFFVMVALIEHALYLLYSWLIPVKSIDMAVDFQGPPSCVIQRPNEDPLNK
jgi:phosphatidylinositol glycan class A protein